jgi:Txe/YoeB family toxin of Txe-Axe toxin-antitoxin module
MHLIFNELSIYPITDNGNVAEKRFKQFLETFKEASDRYGFNHIRFPQNYISIQITIYKTFSEWISTLTNRTFINQILSICKQPFTDELERKELDTFFESNYKIVGDNIPTDIEPIGLPISYIKSIPTISLNTHEFWRKRKIVIQKTADNVLENIDLIAYNVCVKEDVLSQDLSEWADSSIPKLIETKDLLKKYLGFTKYQVDFTDNFMTHFFDWKDNDFETYQYTLLLMKDVQIHPFVGGMGQTENLKYRGKEASKRISFQDRLSYSIENNVVTFIACKGHYQFH